MQKKTKKNSTNPSKKAQLLCYDFVICICLAFAICHLSSIKYCQSATKHCPCIITFALSLTPFLAHLPSLLCVVVWMRQRGEDQQSDHCICFQFPYPL